MPKIIMDYVGRAIFVKTFAIVEQCDRALCQHDATDFVSLLVDSSKSLKVPVELSKFMSNGETLIEWSFAR